MLRYKNTIKLFIVSILQFLKQTNNEEKIDLMLFVKY